VPGRNVLAVAADNAVAGPAGLAAKLEITGEDGKVTREISGDAWRVAKEAGERWEKPDFDDSKWVAVRVVAAMGAGPWGQVAVGDARAWIMHTASPIFRKAFSLKAAPARATVNICGLGYYELHLNGHKVGDRVLDPLFTRYDRRVLYATYDVTDQLAVGPNALGVMLGNGFYNSQSRDAWNFDKTPWRDQPTLRAQLRVEYADGNTETTPPASTIRPGPRRQWSTGPRAGSAPRLRSPSA
jgi:alpha-L-rhamnosidase